MMLQKLKIIGLLILAAQLSFCSTSNRPDVRYYLLATPSLLLGSEDSKLTVRSVVLANYLDQQGIVLVTNDREVSIADYNLWAEPLDVGVRRLMNEELKLGKYSGSGYLDLTIHFFHGDEDGTVLLDADWKIELPCSKEVSGRHVASTAQEADGYSALIDAQATLLKELTADIHAQFQRDSSCGAE